MTSTTFTNATTQSARLYLIENRAGPENEVDFISFGRAESPSFPQGSVDPIIAPSPDRAGEYTKLGTTKGPPEQATVDLVGLYSRNTLSDFLRLARKGCPFDAMVIFGKCRDLKNSDDFEKVVYFPDGTATDFSISALGEREGDTPIEETLPISAEDMFELVPLTYASRAGDIITNQVLDIIIADTASCGDCDETSDGCQKVFGITLSAGGSPGTPADVVFSLDKCGTWQAHDIDSLTVGSDPSAIAKVGTYIVVTSNDDASIEIALSSEFDGVTDPSFSTVTTGIVAGGEPNDIWSIGSKAFVVGDGGYIYSITDPTAGLTVLDAGVAVQDDLNAVHAINENFAIAVGNAGAIVKTENGTIWGAITGPVGVGVNLNAIWIQSEKVWWVGGTDGNLYYTIDGGTTWGTKAFSGSGSGTIHDIQFSNENVGFVAHATTAPLGRILETINGGNTFIVAPRGSGVLPANDQVTALATCREDQNFVVGVGLADDASDGYIVVGEG